MASEILQLHSPTRILRTLEALHFREIKPFDICPPNQLSILYELYPDLMGDFRSFDEGLGGRCQSWRDYPGWWRQLIGKV